MCLSIVFVSSKSCIYITPNESKITSSTANHVDASELPLVEPIYENIERDDDGVNIVPSDNNKFTIYVNYDDIIKGDKCNKSSVRLLEPDVKLVHIHMNVDDIVYHANENNLNGSVDDDHDDDDDNDGDEEHSNCNNSNYIKTTSKMIQCQQISMYIGEKKILLIIFLLFFFVPPSSIFDIFIYINSSTQVRLCIHFGLSFVAFRNQHKNLQRFCGNSSKVK